MMHRFTVPGAELDWSLSGESGPPVVQLHGLGSSRRRDQVQGLDLGRALSATLLRAALRAPDRFGGLTLVIPPTAWETRADQAGDYRRLAEFIERHGMDRFLAASSQMPRPPAVAATP